MKKKWTLSRNAPVPFVARASSAVDTSFDTTTDSTDASSDANMSEANGVLKEYPTQDNVNLGRPTTGRVASASMMRSVLSSTDSSSPSSDSGQAWSSAVGHASTGKSGRVIERLQGDIDRLRREKQLLKVRHEEVEKANDALVTRNQYLQDRNSNYEQSHEATLRQLARKERLVEELREELRKEKLKTSKAQAQAQAASENEENWRDQASQAKSLAAQKEAEYDTIVQCRKVDHDRQQTGLDKIRSSFDDLLRRQEDDLEKQRKLEIIAEQQRQTISQLDELTKRLSKNFLEYRREIDTAIKDLREMNASNDKALTQKLEEMTEVTGHMRWVMKVDQEVNHNVPPPMPLQLQSPPVLVESKDDVPVRKVSLRDSSMSGRPVSQPQPDRPQSQPHGEVTTGRRSPTKLLKHRRKDSVKI